MASVTDRPVRIPIALIDQVRVWAGDDAAAIDRFVIAAIKDRLLDVQDHARLQQRAARGRAELFDQVLAKAGSEPPREDDEVPAGWFATPSA